LEADEGVGNYISMTLHDMGMQFQGTSVDIFPHGYRGYIPNSYRMGPHSYKLVYKPLSSPLTPVIFTINHRIQPLS
jgi:hypothetical protein